MSENPTGLGTLMVPVPLPLRIRVLDLMGATFGILVTLPLWPVIGLAVKVSSPGPVFYRAGRLGAGGTRFEMLKFRSMRTGSDRGAAITVAGDQRVTSVGRILRRTKLDELPQLLNVFRGDMSLVGPRPEAPDYLICYPDALRDILRYRPGITSPASIEYRREEELLSTGSEAGDWAGDPERFYVERVLPQKAALDLAYCRDRGIRSDLRILARTARSVVQKEKPVRS